MAQRGVFGNIGGGRKGVKFSLPNVNPLTADDSDPDLFSFCSAWGDISKIADVGFVRFSGMPGSVINGGEITYSQTIEEAHGLGYVPFCEARVAKGDEIFNEVVSSNQIDSTGDGAPPVHQRRHLLAVRLDDENIHFDLYGWRTTATGDHLQNRFILGLTSGEIIYVLYKRPA